MIISVTRSSTWKHFQARFAEWFNAAILFCWGCYVIIHPGMFTDPRVAGLWRGLLIVANQETWGMLAMVVGLCRCGALYVNGNHRRTPMVRLIASFFSAFILTQIVVGMINSNVPNTGLIVYPALILADIYSAFRASADMTLVASHEVEIEQSEPGRVVNFAQRT